MRTTFRHEQLRYTIAVLIAATVAFFAIFVTARVHLKQLNEMLIMEWQAHVPFAALYISAILGGWVIYRLLTRKLRNRKTVLNSPFPQKWREILNEEVAYYTLLTAPQKAEFEKCVQVFLAETRITGVKTELNDKVKVLIAASAVIPVFGFPDWEYDMLSEVLVYPNTFNAHFAGFDRSAVLSGMVGGPNIGNAMALSKPDLPFGYRNGADAYNVGVHEFAHLIDKADGEIDGIPAIYLNQEDLPKWREIMKTEMEAIHQSRSILNPYGGTQPAEFFAVCAEYFFEKPTALAKYHPDLYQLLCKVFRQDTAKLFTEAMQALFAANPEAFALYAPCPCGSGYPYAQCCMEPVIAPESYVITNVPQTEYASSALTPLQMPLVMEELTPQPKTPTTNTPPTAQKGKLTPNITYTFIPNTQA